MSSNKNIIMTVTGAVPANSLGLMLPHEHVMSMFGADPAEKPDYDVCKLNTAVIPYLTSLKDMGCEALADCTSAWIGRDPESLRDISLASGVRILTNTGYYGAADDRYVPQHAFLETADQLAERWIAEWRDGIGATGIRPGFIKCGVDSGPLSAIDEKLFLAAARTHLESGLIIAVHTGDNAPAAQAQLALLKTANVSPSAWIWVHADKVRNANELVRAAEQGAWIEFDGLAPESIDAHLQQVQILKEKGLSSQILLSHDGNSFRAGNKPPKPYDALFTHFLPKLRSSGFSETEIRALTVDNPARAFAVAVRLGR